MEIAELHICYGCSDVGTLKGVSTMKNKLITEIEQKMLKQLDNANRITAKFFPNSYPQSGLKDVPKNR